jgi:hypothetical protein
MLKHFPKSWLVVGLVSILMALGNSITFFYHLIHEPPDTIYLGTIHYWEDYFFYLNHFFQGSHGAWLTINRYTAEPTDPSLIYWCNLLLGKIGGLFFLPPILSYNLSVIFLSIASLIFSFFLIQKIANQKRNLVLPAFLFATFATSLINRVKSDNGTMILWPFQIWRTPHLAFDRLGGAPHQLIQTILAYLFIQLVFSVNNITQDKKRLMLMILCGICLTSLNPIQALYYVGMLWFTKGILLIVKFLKNRLLLIITKTKQNPIFTSLKFDHSSALFIVSIFICITALYINNVLSKPPHIQSKLWEAVQHSYTTPWFLTLSLGPIFYLAFVGVIVRFKKISEIELFGSFTIISGYFLFLSKIPQTVGFSNLRVLFPASYVFWGIFAAYGVDFLSDKIKQITHISKQFLLLTIVAIFLIISAPTLYWELTFKLPPQGDSQDPVIYLPINIFTGFEYLATKLPYSDIVLASPFVHIDTMIPAFSGHTTYAGHMLTTINNSAKQNQASAFFNLQLTKNQADEQLKQNNIRYVLFTIYDGDQNRFYDKYPFLSKIFANNQVAIFKVR